MKNSTLFQRSDLAVAARCVPAYCKGSSDESWVGFRSRSRSAPRADRGRNRDRVRDRDRDRDKARDKDRDRDSRHVRNRSTEPDSNRLPQTNPVKRKRTGSERPELYKSDNGNRVTPVKNEPIKAVKNEPVNVSSDANDKLITDALTKVQEICWVRVACREDVYC